MPTIDACRELADEIRGIFRKGIELSPEVVDFIDSTYASPSARELLGILNADSDADRDTLLELIFAPDEPFQETLEPLLTRHSFSTQDEMRIQDRLKQPIPEATLMFPDSRGRASVTPPGWVIATLLSQLHISRHLPAAVANTVARSVRESQRNRVRVRLRNMQAELTEPQIDCLCRYLTATDSKQASFFRTLDFLTQFLGGLDSASDIYESLMQRKAECWSQLEQAMKQEEILAKSNMETLLLRGERILHFDKKDLQQTIAAIDDIGMAVFGKKEPLMRQGGTVDLGEYRGVEDLDRLIELLSGN